MLWSHKLTAESVASGQDRCRRRPSSVCALVNIFCKDSGPGRSPLRAGPPSPHQKWPQAGRGHRPGGRVTPRGGPVPHTPGERPRPMEMCAFIENHFGLDKAHSSALEKLTGFCNSYVWEMEIFRGPQKSPVETIPGRFTRTARPGRGRRPPSPAALTSGDRASALQERKRKPAILSWGEFKEVLSRC